MTRSRRTLLTTTTALALAAGGVTHAMKGGAPVSAVDVHTTGAVAIEHDGRADCSGTLVAPRWVLTARHCVIPWVTSYHGGVSLAAPPNQIAAANSGLLLDGTRWISAGWFAPYDPDDPNLADPRTAVLLATTTTGDRDDNFGTQGHASFAFAEHVSSSDLMHVVSIHSATDTSTDALAVGRAMVDGVNYMLIARFDHTGHLLATSMPVTSPGATLAYARVTGVASRVVIAGGKIIVAGADTTNGVSRWRATRYDLAGHPDPTFAPFFADYSEGGIDDVVAVGSYLVWLGHSSGGVLPRYMIATTDLDGHVQGTVQSVPASIPLPSRLVSRAPGAVWVAGTDVALTQARVARMTVPALAPDAGWPAAGAALTLPDIHAAAAVTDLIEANGRVVVTGGWSLAGIRRVLLGRFAADGTVDTAFGQSGLIVTLRNDHDAGAALASGAGVPYMVFGRRGVEYAGKMLTEAFDDQTDQVRGVTLRSGDALPPIARVVRHSDPLVDAALIELASPVDSSHPVVVTELDVRDASELVAADDYIECYGFGEDETGRLGYLERGMAVALTEDGMDLVVEARKPTEFMGGDSGGGCYAGGTTALVGILTASSVNTHPADGTGAPATSGYLVSAADFSAFVASTLAAP